MKRLRQSVCVAVIAVSGCDPAVDTSLISRTPAPAAAVERAETALAICARNLQDYAETVRLIAAAGFAETRSSILAEPQSRFRFRSFASARHGVEITIVQQDRENLCLVGVDDLTPAQSFDLAAPVAEMFGAVTNAERDNGLANNAVEAWALFGPDRNLYIAAYKTWAPLGQPGAAVRLISYDK